MPRGISDKITFKPYEQHQSWLLPPGADELIPVHHLVRVVSRTIDEMNLEPILKRYDKGGGASRYHPVMMFKVLVYGYMTKTYSSRMIAKALRENVMFMWLSGNQTPDFRTINAFRGSRLKDIMEEVFMATVKALAAKGYVKLEHYFVDGTKIESAANKYSFVWKRGIDTNERKLDEKLKAFLRDAERVSAKENEEYGDRDLEEMGEEAVFSAEDVAALAANLNERIAALEKDDGSEEGKKKLKKQVQLVEKDLLVRKKKYEQQRLVLGARNSFSKTDPEATFMRMKEDPMRNGQLKPGYNVQIGTENGYVLGYDIFPNPTDSKTLKPHLERMERRLGALPKRLIADAGYGSSENYAYLARNGVEAYVKYNTFHKEATRKWKTDPYRSEHWPYDPQKDCYRCPEGKELTRVGVSSVTTEAGYRQRIAYYRCESCEGCPRKSACTNAAGDRTIQRNEEMLTLRKAARERLLSDEGTALRKRRAVENETVFGEIKSNWGFRRFHLRGMKKVAVEWGLLAFGYNIKRLMLREGA